MKFDIKDVKSWYNRHDVKVGDEGYFADEIEEFKEENNRTRVITEIIDDHAFCFRTPTNKYSFFLPLDAVKEDKPKEKKYRPFKNLNEIQSVLCGGDVTKYAFFDVGTHLTVRRKNERNREQVILTISIEYMDGHLYLINYRRLDEWFNDFELLVNDTWGPFGIEVEEDEQS